MNSVSNYAFNNHIRCINNCLKCTRQIVFLIIFLVRCICNPHQYHDIYDIIIGLPDARYSMQYLPMSVSLLSVRLSHGCISKTKQDRSIVTMHHYRSWHYLFLCSIDIPR